MFIIEEKWFKRSLVFLVVAAMVLLLSATVLAEDPKPMDSPVGAEIAGFIFYDGNGDGSVQTRRNYRRSDNPMDGAFVILWDVSGRTTPPGRLGGLPYVVDTEYAGNGGLFSFKGLPPGLYAVEVRPPASPVRETLSLPHIENPTTPIEILGGEKIDLVFAFKPYLEFTSYPYLAAPVRLSP